ncbi:MAG TPA: PQQ-binding-like beta-propeller repeat protein [Verrucomicrobiae bacterium]
MKRHVAFLTGTFAVALSLLSPITSASAAVGGWLNWRGPNQNGTSDERGLPDALDPKKPLWVANFRGQSTPVIADGKLYIMGYIDNGPDLQEGVTCFDAETGKQLWQHLFNDFISDIIYLRYATSAPTIDPETGNVFIQGTQGIFACFTPDGKLLWKHSLMEKLGRMTFPNGRTPSPLIDGDYVITRYITSNWGAQGAAGDRFYAFDKKTGELVWASSPGDRPRDNSFSYPFLSWYKGYRVFYTAVGDGSVACINARTGEPIWRVNLFKAGINATVCVHNNDKVIAVFGTPYEPGQMVALKIPDVMPKPGAAGPVVVERSEVELWSNPGLSSSASSPILAGDRVYLVKEKGELSCVDAKTGKVLWNLQLGIEQRNACPLYADGKLYVPILDDPDTKGDKAGEGTSEAGTKGGFYIIKPSDAEGKIINKVSLDGRCFGSPTAYNGKIYVQTAEKLYCFGKAGNNPGLAKAKAPETWPKPGPATQLQIIPSEVLLYPNQTASFRIRSLDAKGLVVQEGIDPKSVKWESYIPPTALVKAKMDASFNAEGKLATTKDAKMSAGAFEATLGNLKGYIRGRALSGIPIKQDFESFMLSETTTNTVEEPTKFAYPPLPWIGARFRFEVREIDGTKALCKTIENKLFQRGTIFLGDPTMKNYTVQTDIYSEGNRRKMSDAGIIVHRYQILLKGNEQKLEINSNLERLRVPAPEAPPNFRWLPNTWYTLKGRVDTKKDGTGVIRAKAWKRGEPEPEAWTLEVEHKTAHQEGSPGLFSFSPQEMRIYLDNVSVTPNN